MVDKEAVPLVEIRTQHLTAIIVLFILCLAHLIGLMWSLRLQSSLSQLSVTVARISDQFDEGILPVAKERLDKVIVEHQKLMSEALAQRIETQRALLEIDVIKSQLMTKRGRRD